MHIDLQNTKVGGFNYELLRAMSYSATGGTELGECLAAATCIEEGNFESWIAEWTRLADRVAQEGEVSLHKGRRISARNAFLRASNYYRAAEFYASYEHPRQYAAWTRSRVCFREAASLMSPPIEVVEIPFEGVKLPGYFVSGGQGKRPTLIAMGGLGSSGEEVYHWIGAAAAERGWHCLIFEGPGQRGALHLNPGLTLRPDYEFPMHAVVDYVLGRPEVDGEQLALIGYSLGGYLAPRAAAFEPRIKACIANSLVVDVGKAWRAAPGPVFDAVFATLSHANYDVRWGIEHGRWAMGIGHPHEFFSAWKPYTLSGLEERLQCPLLCLFGEDEVAEVNQEILEETLRFINALHCVKAVHLFTREEGAAGHCQMGDISRAQAVIFDWLEDIFTAQHQVDTSATSRLLIEHLTEFVKKYHGEAAAKRLPKLDLGIGQPIG